MPSTKILGFALKVSSNTCMLIYHHHTSSITQINGTTFTIQVQNLTKCRMEDKTVKNKISLRPCFVIPFEQAHSPDLWGAQDKKLPSNSSESLNPHVFQKTNYLLLIQVGFLGGFGGFFGCFFLRFILQDALGELVYKSQQIIRHISPASPLENPIKDVNSRNKYNITIPHPSQHVHYWKSHSTESVLHCILLVS